MKEFLRIKTVQLIIEIVLAITFLVPILSDSETYHLIASNPDVKFVCGGIWAVFAVSFIFLFYDFYMYDGDKKINADKIIAIKENIVSIVFFNLI